MPGESPAPPTWPSPRPSAAAAQLPRAAALERAAVQTALPALSQWLPAPPSMLQPPSSPSPCAKADLGIAAQAAVAAKCDDFDVCHRSHRLLSFQGIAARSSVRTHHSPSPTVSRLLCSSLRSHLDLGRQRPLHRSRSVALSSPLSVTTHGSVKVRKTDAQGLHELVVSMLAGRAYSAWCCAAAWLRDQREQDATTPVVQPTKSART